MAAPEFRLRGDPEGVNYRKESPGGTEEAVDFLRMWNRD